MPQVAAPLNPLARYENCLDVPFGQVKQYCVYTHYRADGSPFYIGRSDNLKRPYNLRRNEWHDNIVAKDGKKNIRVAVIPCRTFEQSKQLEIWLIRICRKMGARLTNLSDGGEGLQNPPQYVRQAQSAGRKGKTHTEETKIKMKESQSARDPNTRYKIPSQKGRKLSPEHVAKVVSAHKGAKRSEEARRNIGAAMRVVNTGRKQSAEHIQKRIASRLKTLAERAGK